MKPLYSIRDFSKGFTDRFGRGKTPDGFMEDCLNLVPTKEGSLETTHGYMDDLASYPTGFADKVGTGTFNIAKSVADPFAFSSELPSPYDGRIYFFEDDDGTKRIALDTWFRGATMDPTSGSANAQTAHGGFVLLDERKEATTDVTISGASTHTITIVDGPSVHGFSPTADYYNGWRVSWLDDLVYGTAKYHAYITDYAVTGGSSVFTVLEDIGSGANNWVAYSAANDKLVFQRWFHRPEDMSPTFDSPPGQCFESDSRVRGCGGASSSQHKFPWIAQYINRAFFNNAVTYQGTYVDEMECSPFCDGGGVDGPVLNNFDISHNGLGGDHFSGSDTFEFATTLEYDGYEESPLSDWTSAGTPTNADDYITWDTYVNFARISKRVTAFNLYARMTTGGITSQAYHIKRISISTGSSTSWNWNDASSCFKFSRVAGSESAIYASEWVNRGSTYYARTGRVEESSSTVRHIVAWKYTEVVAGRRFYAYFYDPNEATVITDFVRFTPIEQSGASNFDIMPYERDAYEVEAASGDPSGVKGLMNDNGWLTVFKDSSIYAWYIGPNPEAWVSNTVSLRDGLYSDRSLVRLPEGIGFADVDDFKMVVNQRVVNISYFWHDTYYALTKSSIKSWYDKIDGTLRFVDGADSTNRKIYICFLGRQGFPWFKMQHPVGEYAEFICTLRDGTVVFTNQLLTKTVKFSKTAYTYGSNFIRPYLKTPAVVLDEHTKFAIDKIVVTKSGNATAGTLLNQLYLDTTAVTVGGNSPWLNEDKTKTSLFEKLPATANKRMGRRIQFAYNTSASGEYCSTAKMQIDEIAFFGVPVEPSNQSR